MRLSDTLFTAALTLFTLTSAAQAAEWTGWLDRDNPSGSGDWEWVAELYAHGQMPCDDPIDIEVRRKSDGVDVSQTGEAYKLGVAGFRCLRSEQPDNACDDYEARFLCPDPADGAWSAWIDRDSPGGSGDYERANGDYAGGNIDCLEPIAIQTRRVSDHFDMVQTGEVYSFWTDYPYGFTCYNANQPDGACDDYESRYFCPSAGYAAPPYGDDDGEIDMGDFVIVYEPDDVVDGGDDYYYVDSGFEIWFGSVYLDFDDAMLQLEVVDGALSLHGALVSATPTSNFPAFAVMDLVPGGVDITLGYGSGALLADIEAPLNPEYDFLFLEIALGSFEFGNISVSAPGAASALIAIAPDPVTVYMNVAGVFPNSSPVSISEAGIGFSVADGLLWQPAATWNFENEMVDQTGNLWLDATIAIGVNDALSVDFAGEVLGDVDFGAVANGEDGLETLAFNGAVSVAVGPDFLQISQDIADMSVLYTAADNRWIAVAETADLSEGMLGAAQWLELSTTAKIAVAVQDDALESLTIRGDISILDDYTLGNATISADADSASFSGTLDLFTSDLSVTGSIYDGGFSLSGSTYQTLASGFYKVRAIATLTQSGLSVSLGVAAWNFDSESYGGYTNISASYSANSGWCATISGLTVCLAPGGGLTLGGDLGDEIEAALDEGWQVVSGAVRDAGNAVVADVLDRLDDLINGRCWLHSQCGGSQWCYIPTGACKNKSGGGTACSTGVECNSGTCINVCFFGLCGGVCT